LFYIPQCKVLPITSRPPNSYSTLFPRLSTMSISPLAGHSPYVDFSGIIPLDWIRFEYQRTRGDSQIAGQIQSPCGSFAVTSTRPYLILFLPLVFSRADRTGGNMEFVDRLDFMKHSLGFVPVHASSPLALVKLRDAPLKICSFVILVDSVVRVGTICRPSAST
jgi:hypothetical protein